MKTLIATLAVSLAAGAAEAHPAAPLHVHAASETPAVLVLLGVFAVWAVGVRAVETIAARRGV